MVNGCQLIAYPDSIGTGLRDLERFLTTRLSGAVTGVHILPFYPSSGDRGFAPLTYTEVAPEFGTWDDIRSIAARFDLTADFMINHISRRSRYFTDFLARGEESPYADMFIRFSRFWPGGEPGPGDLEAVYTRKPRPPFVEVDLPGGSDAEGGAASSGLGGKREKVWCTFDEEQIDLDLSAPVTREFVAESLRFLCGMGVKMIRLDAFAYAVKKPGTGCFFVEPDVWEILDFARRTVEPFGVEVLPEVHEHHSIQLAIAGRGYPVYDFALPMLVLQAIYDGNAGNLKAWLRKAPRRQFTTLDTHDGIGVVDVAGLMSGGEIRRTVDNLYARGANVKRIYNTGDYGNLDIYQLNCTYYSALGDDDDRYLLARAIQFFTPGIPQVYYVGLLAGKNDIGLLERTRVGRNINRHCYSVEEAEGELARPVVRRLLALMRFRGSFPAFSGEFLLRETAAGELRIAWRKDDWETELSADLAEGKFRIFRSVQTEAGPGGRPSSRTGGMVPLDLDQT